MKGPPSQSMNQMAAASQLPLCGSARIDAPPLVARPLEVLDRRRSGCSRDDPLGGPSPAAGRPPASSGRRSASRARSGRRARPRTAGPWSPPGGSPAAGGRPCRDRPAAQVPTRSKTARATRLGQHAHRPPAGGEAEVGQPGRQVPLTVPTAGRRHGHRAVGRAAVDGGDPLADGDRAADEQQPQGDVQRPRHAEAADAGADQAPGSAARCARRCRRRRRCRRPRRGPSRRR